MFYLPSCSRNAMLHCILCGHGMAMARRRPIVATVRKSRDFRLLGLFSHAPEGLGMGHLTYIAPQQANAAYWRRALQPAKAAGTGEWGDDGAATDCARPAAI